MMRCAERLARVLARQVVIERADAVVSVHRAGQLGERVRNDDQRLLRVRSAVAR